MSFLSMKSELASIPKVSRIFAGTLINRALQKIYDDSSWSFQLAENGWLSPGLVGGGTTSAGTVTFSIGSQFVVGDATATAAWQALSGLPLITQYQIRSPAYALYSIISYDGVSTLTLDRPWLEPVSGAGQTYMMYQAYYPVPSAVPGVPDFKRFLAVQDFQNGDDLDYWSLKQDALANRDPQRQIFANADYVVPFAVDQRPGSATFGYMLFELWPHQLSQLSYHLYFLRNGQLLVKDTDTVPYPLDEETTLWRAKMLMYEWKESQKGETAARGSGADFRFLMEAANAAYVDKMRQIRAKDRDLVDNFIRKIRHKRLRRGSDVGFYSAISSTAVV